MDFNVLPLSDLHWGLPPAVTSAGGKPWASPALRFTTFSIHQVMDGEFCIALTLFFHPVIISRLFSTRSGLAHGHEPHRCTLRPRPHLIRQFGDPTAHGNHAQRPLPNRSAHRR